MGTDDHVAGHFCGESPRHLVRLSSFALAQVPVTNELYALFDPSRATPQRDLRKPVVDVTWFDAVLFAMWMGCRLPSEAEWEYGCGVGADAEWCVGHEADLPRHAWFSENSRGVVHRVATREPNSLDLHDMHGNAWEWCRDSYDARAYATASPDDPLGRGKGRKVVRGGSMNALAEMCRTRYRQPEPPDLWASDLGFRLARNHDDGT
jgi:formylglycine-generating enzyme required for sulfatase activity